MEREIENSAEIAANTIEPIEKKSRNCAFDIARIVAMFLIVCSHFLGHGGFIRNMTGGEFRFRENTYVTFQSVRKLIRTHRRILHLYVEKTQMAKTC